MLKSKEWDRTATNPSLNSSKFTWGPKHGSVMKMHILLLSAGTNEVYFYPPAGAVSQQRVQQLLQVSFQVQLLAQCRQLIPVQESRGWRVAAIKLRPQLGDVVAVVIVLHHHEAWRCDTQREIWIWIWNDRAALTALMIKQAQRLCSLISTL